MSSEQNAPAAPAAATAAAAAPALPEGVPPPDVRYGLLRSVGEECISETELRNLCEKKPSIRSYDGFEPSGRMHIAQGLYKATNVNKCTAAGGTFVFWVADFFALLNSKMGGDLASIQLVGKYFLEVWKAAGMDMNHVEFQWASAEITKQYVDYWTRVLDIGRRSTVKRIMKCCQIMGRTENSLTSAQILYPLMQCADIFFLKVDVCQLGVDQRKVNMLAREYCDSIGRKLKPVILSHHMLAGLAQGQAKMSKSNPDSAIFMEDTPEDVARKIGKAYCPRTALSRDVAIAEDGACAADDDKNPCLEYIRYIIFSRPNATFPAIKGVNDDKPFATYEAVEQAFVSGAISEEQLKGALIAVLNELLEPIRQHFLKDDAARALLDEVKTLREKVAAAASSAAPAADASASASGAAAAAASAAAKPVHGVAWLPCSTRVPLGTLLSLVEELNRFVAAHAGAQCTLVLPDWACMSNGVLRGEAKDIAAALEYHADVARALGLHASVKIVKESEIMAADPNRFWLGVITAGRRFTLAEVEKALETAGAPAEQAGHIIAVLMHAVNADVLGATHLFTTQQLQGHNEIAAAFVAGNSGSGAVPATVKVATVLPDILCDPATKPSGVDDWLYCDESEMDARRKIKKAFCAPGNVATPVLALAACAVSGGADANANKLVIERNEDNGGNKEYTAADALTADFAAQQLHPGDLKAAVTKAFVAKFVAPVQACIGTTEQKKRATALRNAEKKT